MGLMQSQTKTTSLFTNLNFKAGSGEFNFPDPADDPVVRLKPTKITSALYGTLNDAYQETLRAPKNLK